MPVRTCIIDSCNNKHMARGWCFRHYNAWYNYGDPNAGRYVHHGMRKHPLYKTWDSMKQRTTDPKHRSYVRYGGRGVKMCDRWLKSFKSFVEDVDKIGERPTRSHTLDRIDNDGDYEPGNIRWASKSQQVWNAHPWRKKTHKYKGITFSKGKWVAQINLNGMNLYLGRYVTQEEAADAYDQAAVKAFGEYAWLNKNHVA